MKTAVVIGGGLSGLQCGVVLSRNGYRVVVLEKDASLGGCLQTFRRGGFRFDTGFHYVGGLGEGESLYPLFRYFDLLDLGWVRMDEDCVDEIVLDGESFHLPSSHERFLRVLSERFPSQRKGLEEYVSTLRGIGEHIADAFEGKLSPAFSQGAYPFLCEHISDPLLRKVLSGSSVKIHLDPEALPLYVFGQTNNSFIQSAWRLRGGGSEIVDHLAGEILSLGGEIHRGSPVVSIDASDGRVDCVRTESLEISSPDVVVSSMHPVVTMSLLSDGAVRNIYRSRISSLGNSFGVFTCNIVLKEGAMDYLGRNIVVHAEGSDPWKVDLEGTGCVMVHFYPETYPDGSARALDLLCPMDGASLSQWFGTKVGARGEDYLALKERKAQECISLVSGRLPRLRDAISKVYTSTPLTYMDYTGTPNGSAFGILKDYHNIMGTILSPRTPLSNLYLTGQSLNLHGVLGTSMTSILTCSAILGRRIL